MGGGLSGRHRLQVSAPPPCWGFAAAVEVVCPSPSENLTRPFYLAVIWGPPSDFKPLRITPEKYRITPEKYCRGV